MRYISIPFLGLGSLLFIISIFDLITSKYRLRFPERISKRKDNPDLFDLMRERRSCRSYQIKKLTGTNRNELMESVRIRTEEAQAGESSIRFEYISAPITVWPVVNASEFLIAIAPKEYDRSTVKNIGRCLQKIVVDATRMGLASCWIGPGADQKSIIREMGNRFDSGKDSIVCLCAVGYKSQYMPLFIRAFNNLSKRRLPLSELFYADSDLKQPLDITSTQLAPFGRNFEICQWSPSSFNGQTTRAVANVDDKGDLIRLDFYTTTASRYYTPIALGIWCTNWELGCEAQGIKGHFSVLSAEERMIKNNNESYKLPKYDVSWVGVNSK